MGEIIDAVFPRAADAPKTLTLASLQEALDDMRRADDDAREAAWKRADAWHALDLDYAAMDVEEKRLVLMAQSDFVFHPRDAKRLDAVVAKYRRDTRG